jgi:hypothetical protein
MARGKKRSSRHSRKSAPAVTYTVTIGNEYTECDSCCLPTQMLIEQVGGAWICEICNSGIDGDDLWKAAVIGGVYSGGEW